MSSVAQPILHEPLSVPRLRCKDGVCRPDGASSDAMPDAVMSRDGLVTAPSGGRAPIGQEQIFASGATTENLAHSQGPQPGTDPPPVRRSRILPDSATGPETGGERLYHEVFAPAVYPYKRMSVLDGVDDLRRTLAELVPAGPFHYPEDQMSDAPMRQLAAEITREKIYQKLHQELPYQSTVETDSWTERKDKSIRIEQTIFVERESQRKIVLGKSGATIKSIGAESRKEIAEIMGVPVHLFLFVKVRENWGDDPDRYREMGLEFPRE